MVCPECQLSIHHDHKIIAIIHLAKEIENELKERLESAQLPLEKALANVEQIISSSGSINKDKITEIFSSIRATINESASITTSIDVTNAKAPKDLNQVQIDTAAAAVSSTVSAMEINTPATKGTLTTTATDKTKAKDEIHSSEIQIDAAAPAVSHTIAAFETNGPASKETSPRRLPGFLNIGKNKKKYLRPEISAPIQSTMVHVTHIGEKDMYFNNDSAKEQYLKTMTSLHTPEENELHILETENHEVVPTISSRSDKRASDNKNQTVQTSLSSTSTRRPPPPPLIKEDL
ncbi:unnamed protein product [Rotaria sordida]|nr:unnamed protein product [Rotaria sordida]